MAERASNERGKKESTDNDVVIVRQLTTFLEVVF